MKFNRPKGGGAMNHWRRQPVRDDTYGALMAIWRDNFESTGNAVFAARALAFARECDPPRNPPDWVLDWLSSAFGEWEQSEGRERVDKLLGLTRTAYKDRETMKLLNNLEHFAGAAKSLTGLSIDDIANRESRGKVSKDEIGELVDILENIEPGTSAETLRQHYRKRGKKWRDLNNKK